MPAVDSCDSIGACTSGVRVVWLAHCGLSTLPLLVQVRLPNGVYWFGRFSCVWYAAVSLFWPPSALATTLGSGAAGALPPLLMITSSNHWRSLLRRVTAHKARQKPSRKSKRAE